MAYYDPRKEEEILSERAAAARAGDPAAMAGGAGSGGVVPADGGGADDFAADGYALGPDESLTAGGTVVAQSSGTTRAAGSPGSGDAGSGQSAAKRAAAERAATEADLEDWYRYVPKPDYETLERRARRQEQAALLGDIAQIAGQFYGTAGKNGGWMVQPLGNRYAKAREKRDAVEARKRAAWQDYGGKQLSYLMSRRKERAAQAAAEQKNLLDHNYKVANLTLKREELNSRNEDRE